MNYFLIVGFGIRLTTVNFVTQTLPGKYFQIVNVFCD